MGSQSHTETQRSKACAGGCLPSHSKYNPYVLRHHPGGSPDQSHCHQWGNLEVVPWGNGGTWAGLGSFPESQLSPKIWKWMRRRLSFWGATTRVAGDMSSTRWGLSWGGLWDQTVWVSLKHVGMIPTVIPRTLIKEIQQSMVEFHAGDHCKLWLE